MLDCAQTAALLQGWDKILVMSHASPDGDTLGSACALMGGLQALGKEVGFFCPDPVPEKFAYLFEGISLGEFEPEHVVSVDVADKALLGRPAPQELICRTELSIDHHGTHVPFAQERWVEPEAAATTELIYALLRELGVEITPALAGCLYTGLSTDTGCFRYRNVTPRTHRIAADLLELGAPGAEINRRMFESKTKGQVEAERRAMEGMRFSWEGKCALVRLPFSIFGETGVQESDLDGVAAMPREIQGVVLGVTLKEKEDGRIKASVRANPPADASVLCKRFGGGGHQGAAGCSLGMVPMEEAAAKMEEACGAYLKELGLI